MKAMSAVSSCAMSPAPMAMTMARPAMSAVRRSTGTMSGGVSSSGRYDSSSASPGETGRAPSRRDVWVSIQLNITPPPTTDRRLGSRRSALWGAYWMKRANAGIRAGTAGASVGPFRRHQPLCHPHDERDGQHDHERDLQHREDQREDRRADPDRDAEQRHHHHEQHECHREPDEAHEAGDQDELEKLAHVRLR